MLKKEWLIFTGEMAIVSAVITIPAVVSLFILDSFEGLVPQVSSILIMTIMLGFFLYIYTIFRKLLNQRFQFHNVNTYISILIFLNIINLPVNIFYMFTKDEAYLSRVAMGASILLMVLYGVFLVLFAFRLLDIQNELFGFRKSYCYATMICGVCFAVVICFPIGYIAGVVSDVLLGLIFFKAAEQLSVESAPEI